MIPISAGWRTRAGAEARHQAVLLARDPGPMIGYLVMGLLLMTATRPLYSALARGSSTRTGSGVDQAAAGMAVMFSLFALKIAGAHLLDERTWHTWDRLRATPASLDEILIGKTLPIYAAILAQQVLLFAFASVAFGLHPRAGWWTLAACIAGWSGCVLLLGTGWATLARTPAQLSAAGDLFALLTSVLGGAIVPIALLPGALHSLAPISPGYWGVQAYRAALTATPGQLVHPFVALAGFGILGAVATVVLGAGRSQRFPRGRAGADTRASAHSTSSGTAWP
jgi:ABC-2 type transport system permease protein